MDQTLAAHLAQRWFLLRYRLAKLVQRDEWAQRFAWWLPRRVAYWAFIRVHGHATRIHSDRHVLSLLPEEIAKAWEMRPNG